MKFCSKCGNSIRDYEQYCSVCGQLKYGTEERNSFSVDISYSIPIPDSQPSKKRSGGYLVTIVVVLGIMTLLSLTGKKSSNKRPSKGIYRSYNAALDALADGLTNADGRAICHAMLTDEMVATITQEQFDSMSEQMDIVNNAVSQVTGEKPKWRFTEKSSVKLSDDKIGDIQYYYRSHLGMGLEINEAYQVKVKMKFGEQSDYIYINVIKVPNEGWKVSEEFMTMVMGWSD